MTSIPTKFAFDKFAAGLVGTSQSVICEALTGKHFRETVTYSEHRQTIARVLLLDRPDLIGVLPTVFQRDPAEAIQLATENLISLRDRDPLLFEHSYVPKPQVVKWVLRASPNRDPEQVRSEVNYAQEQIAWGLRYASQHHLAEQGADLQAIRAQIERGDR